MIDIIGMWITMDWEAAMLTGAFVGFVAGIFGGKLLARRSVRQIQRSGPGSYNVQCRGDLRF